MKSSGMHARTSGFKMGGVILVLHQRRYSLRIDHDPQWKWVDMAFNSWMRGRQWYFGREDTRKNQDVWKKIKLAMITTVYGLGFGRVLYEGCHGILNDKNPCALGRSTRWDRFQGFALLAMVMNQNREGHTCSRIGKGLKMWNFVVVIDDMNIDIF